MSRMKYVELTCELMASIARGGPLNKKKALDEVIGGQAIEGAKLKKSAEEFIRIANLAGKMLHGYARRASLTPWITTVSSCSFGNSTTKAAS